MLKDKTLTYISLDLSHIRFNGKDYINADLKKQDSNV